MQLHLLQMQQISTCQKMGNLLILNNKNI